MSIRLLFPAPSTQFGQLEDRSLGIIPSLSLFRKEAKDVVGCILYALLTSYRQRRQINSNGRIPAITDDDFNAFETSAILLCPAQELDKEHKFT